jgi:nitroreductase
MHLILAARGEGLGTCWVGAFDNDEIRRLLEISDDFEVVAAMPLGCPSDDVFKSSANRKSLDEMISVDRF